MNPPFGTKDNKEIFLSFLKTADLITEGPIFIIHKKAFEKKLVKLAKEFNRSFEILHEFQY